MEHRRIHMTCRYWQRGTCHNGEACRYYHVGYHTNNSSVYYPEDRRDSSRSYRGGYPVTRIPPPARGLQRINSAAPTPATRLQNLRLETSRNTELRRAASTASAVRETEPSILVAAPTGEAAEPSTTSANEASSSTTSANEASSSTTSANEASSSTPEKESDDILIYEPRLKKTKRFLKTECALITQIIEENFQNNDLDAIAILEKASGAVMMRLGIIHSARDCWIYWSYRGRNQSAIARDWPPESEEVDEEVMAFERIRRAPDAVMVQVAVPATRASVLLPKEQREHLCEVIKKKKSNQYGMSVETFWKEVEEAMNQAGYAHDRHKQREYWEKDGRQEFTYDERPYFTRLIKNMATKQTNPTSLKSPANRIRLSARRNNPGQGVMSADSPIQQNKGKKRRSDPDEYKPKKCPKPQMLTDMVTYRKSRCKEKDYTAKNANDHPIELIIPSAGERFTPYNRPPEPPEPPASPSPPNSPLLHEAAQQMGLPAPPSPISQQPAERATRSIEQSSDRESTPILDAAEEALGLFGPETPQRRSFADSQNFAEYTGKEDNTNNRTRRPAVTMRREESAVVPSDTGATGSRLSKTPSLIEDDSMVSDETMDVPQPSQTTSTNFNIFATPTLTAENSASPDEQMVDNSHSSQSTPMDGIETDDIVLKGILQKKLEQANSEISNLQTSLLQSRRENADTEKKIVVAIENLIMMGDALKKSHADNMTEIQRLEEEIKKKEASKEQFQVGMTKVLNRTSK
ncbi:hypothetical protein OCU04_001676 [Sclerotinia nivalis]|uniref:C3H1-type domain-containing protein n=1 Tax=Sclerotinia nivalis TaxID=352851 RepID=A0A9X0AYI9_9HELO|nr:hypothetical protein OCU04_001676 [Sclerotinia nivalis]